MIKQIIIIIIIITTVIMIIIIIIIIIVIIIIIIIIIVIIIIIIIIVIIISPSLLKYRVGVRRGIVCLMGRKNSSALGGSLSRDGVSIKTLVGGTIKHNLKESEMSNQRIKNNDVNGAGITSCGGIAPVMHGIPDPASAGRH